MSGLSRAVKHEHARIVQQAAQMSSQPCSLSDARDCLPQAPPHVHVMEQHPCWQAQVKRCAPAASGCTNMPCSHVQVAAAYLHRASVATNAIRHCEDSFNQLLNLHSSSKVIVVAYRVKVLQVCHYQGQYNSLLCLMQCCCFCWVLLWTTMLAPGTMGCCLMYSPVFLAHLELPG